LKSLPAGMQADLDSGSTHMAHCWLLVRNNGTSSGYTEHDEDLFFDNVTYDADTGFTSSSFQQTSGLSVDGSETAGILSAATLIEDDLAAGLYDNSEVTIFLVDWTDVSKRVIIAKGNIGEVTRGDLDFTAEFRSEEHKLNQPVGRLFQKLCDADLGDTRCGFILMPATGMVTAVTDNRTFAASGLDIHPLQHFTRGLLTWTSGANNGFSMEVRRHSKAGVIVTLSLYEEMAFNISAGDGFTVTTGCDKSWNTCKTRFDNGDNFRGYPHMPGNQFLIRFAGREDANSGGSLVGN